MVEERKPRLSRNDWLMAALAMSEGGIDKIKVAPLATDLGVTTGSFYWHFKNRGELLDALLEFWEHEMTDAAIAAARAFAGSPSERIYFTMNEIMTRRLTRYDLAIWHWAKSNGNAKHVFKRVLQKRLIFATRLFVEAGFSKRQAEIRGRMMVLDLMSESNLVPKRPTRQVDPLREKHALLLSQS